MVKPLPRPAQVEGSELDVVKPSLRDAPIRATSRESDACLCKVVAKSGLGERLLDDAEGGHMNIAFNGLIFAVNGSLTLRCTDA